MEVLTSEKTIPNSKTLVFTNSVRTCNFVSKFLRETETVAATSLHGEMPPKVRSANYKKFAEPKSGCDVLVCTNLASRGVDLDSVNHVIMYDFPHTLADYIHRAGRTGRAGRLGKVTALYTKRNLVLARQIEQAARLGKPIEYAKPKHESASPRRAVKLEKYRAALDDMKSAPRGAKTQRLRALRSSLGLPPNIRIGSPAKRLSAKAWKEDEKKREILDLLKKRKRVNKRVERLPDLPNRVHAASETRTQSRVVRHRQSGDLQMVTSRR
jgi:superfamily II DNA/RNA helicase